MDSYSHMMREAVQADLQEENTRLRASALRLAREKQQVEHLLNDYYHTFVGYGLESLPPALAAHLAALQARAKALVEQETK